MFDYRLKVFLSAAQRLSFTKAAQELFISQPAVSKHIKAIEKEYECTLFDRKGNALKLTPQGEVLKKYALQILLLHRDMDNEIRFYNAQHSGILNTGASTTAAQYVLPRFLAAFRGDYPDVQLTLKTGNTEHIENLLLNKKIDIGIVEGGSKRRHLEYRPFQRDEIVLCTGGNTPSQSILKIDDLRKLPFVVREKGSGTLEIIRTTLLAHKLKLDELPIALVLENNESIKSYLKSSDAFAFISISAIMEELGHHQLKIIDVENLSMERYYYIVTRKEVQNSIVTLFQKALLHNK